jgi:hypothetical protein
VISKYMKAIPGNLDEAGRVDFIAAAVELETEPYVSLFNAVTKGNPFLVSLDRGEVTLFRAVTSERRGDEVETTRYGRLEGATMGRSRRAETEDAPLVSVALEHPRLGGWLDFSSNLADDELAAELLRLLDEVLAPASPS